MITLFPTLTKRAIGHLEFIGKEIEDDYLLFFNLFYVEISNELKGSIPPWWIDGHQASRYLKQQTFLKGLPSQLLEKKEEQLTISYLKFIGKFQ